MEDFNRKPEFYQYTQTFDLSEGPLTFYLDASKKGKVNELCFEGKGAITLQKSLNQLCLKVKGLPLGELPIFDEETNFPFTTFLYRRFLQDIRQTLIPFSFQKGRDPQNLVCRCFGVYKEDIHELIGSGVEVLTLRDLGDHLSAGVGCGSCHVDLKHILEPLIPVPVAVETKSQQPLWEKLDPQGLAQEIFQVVQSFNSEDSSFELKLKGTRPGGVLLGCKWKQIGEEEKVKLLIERKIEENLGPGLELLISFSS